MDCTPEVLLFEYLSGEREETRSTGAGSQEVLLLEIETGPEDGKIFEIFQPSIHIGSDPSCEICLPDPTVSHLHCIVRLVSGRILAEDLNSSNGTWLNTRPFHKGELHSGDMIQVGQTVLRVEVALKRPTAASLERRTLKIGKSERQNPAHPRPKTEALHWQEQAPPDENRPVGALGQLFRLSQNLKAHLPHSRSR
jgi:pSer/pThr/pTyr-binding forkhead associated (FHA) protein